MLNPELLFKVEVLLNDVHLELEDDDHDVIHAVFSPLSFKVVMKKLMKAMLLTRIQSKSIVMFKV